MASGVMKCAREHKLDLPKDLAIIGFDNVHFTNYLYPTLTTVDNPVEKMGIMAANLVLKQVYKQNRANIEHIFTPNLLIRYSTTRLTRS